MPRVPSSRFVFNRQMGPQSAGSPRHEDKWVGVPEAHSLSPPLSPPEIIPETTCLSKTALTAFSSAGGWLAVNPALYLCRVKVFLGLIKSKFRGRWPSVKAASQGLTQRQSTDS